MHSAKRPRAYQKSRCLRIGSAGKLDVSDNTVRTHMRNLYRKLQIHSRQDAIELVEGFGKGEGARALS